MPTPDPLPSTYPMASPVVVTASLLSGAGIEALDLRLSDGALLRVSVTRGAMAEIAALAASTLTAAAQAPTPATVRGRARAA